SVALVRAPHILCAAPLLLGGDPCWGRGGREGPVALKNKGKGRAPTLDFRCLAHPRRYEHVEIARIGGDAVDGAFLTPELAAYDAHTCAIIVDDLGDIGTLDVLITRRGHLQ